MELVNLAILDVILVKDPLTETAILVHMDMPSIKEHVNLCIAKRVTTQIQMLTSVRIVLVHVQNVSVQLNVHLVVEGICT